VAGTFLGHLRSVVAARGADRGFSFLEEGRTPKLTRLTFAELDAGARARASFLAESTEPGQPVLLLYPEGHEFLQAFLGCLYAGRIAVPAPPPHDERSFARVRRIVDDAGIRLVLTTGTLADRLGDFIGFPGRAGRLECATTDGAVGAGLPDPDTWRTPDIDGDSIVLLQYTSGSTSDPKGVVIRHRHLLSNAAAIRRAFRFSDSDRVVTWLPHYHDMGLMGTLLQPLHDGMETIFMAPFTFLKRPYRWLEVVTSARSTCTVAPDFAYDLCTQRVTDAQLERLDLSSLRIAMNGAEPIRAHTLRAFARRFAPAGFRPEAFAPCYGMAEITLFATAAPVDAPPREIVVDPAGLERHEVVELAPGADDGLTLVSSGRPSGVEILIVDPTTRQVLPERRVGEIWLRGGHVSGGYVGAPAVNAEVFGGTTADGRGPYLRTGDLGFLIDGEVVVNGRIKDVVIINGRNIYPQDIEQAARAVHPALDSLVTAAFAVDDGTDGQGRTPSAPGREHVVVIQEVMPDRVGISLPELAASIRSQVARSFEIPAPTVALVHRGVIKRTTSGKIRRRAMRDAFTADGLQPIHLEPSQRQR
jgi:acyl-CoA synthetase (AMP-forming)/AMP-acid ligase II